MRSSNTFLSILVFSPRSTFIISETTCVKYTFSNAYTLDIRFLTDLPGKVQYLKTQVRGGQLFQLRAVFQHKDRPDGGKNSTRSSRVSRSARDKDLSNRYAQIISQTNQVFVFVMLNSL